MDEYLESVLSEVFRMAGPVRKGWVQHRSLFVYADGAGGWLRVINRNNELVFSNTNRLCGIGNLGDPPAVVARRLMWEMQR